MAAERARMAELQAENGAGATAPVAVSTAVIATSTEEIAEANPTRSPTPRQSSTPTLPATVGPFPYRHISMPPPATIAAFDFDGTLTTRDSLLHFVSWRRRRVEVVLDLVQTLPLLALYGARLVGNETHKMALFARAFRDMPADAFERRAREFARSELPRMIRAEALERVRFHQERGDRVVLISASPTDWIVPWAESEGITEIIGNPAEVVDGRVTGRLAGANCYGPEKVRRLLALNPERESYTLFAYGDGRGDRELLAAANHAYHRCFE